MQSCLQKEAEAETQPADVPDEQPALPGECGLMCGAREGETVDPAKPEVLLKFEGHDCRHCDRTYRTFASSFQQGHSKPSGTGPGLSVGSHPYYKSIPSICTGWSISDIRGLCLWQLYYPQEPLVSQAASVF